MGETTGRGPRPRAGARCVALVGPFGSGKTTLLEAILARTDAIPRQGTIAAGNTVGDSSPEARSHGMSVELNVAETKFVGDDYTFLDCPGSPEFLGEMDGVLPAVDCAVVVAEADPRKIPALQLIMKRLKDAGVPHLMFLNKVDKVDGSVRATLEMLQPACPEPLVLRQLPLRRDGAIVGTIDLALERAYIWHAHAPSEVVALPDAEKAREMEARFAMLERLADHDDELMEILISDETPPVEKVFEDLGAEMKRGEICPVFLGSAENGTGIVRLLKALRHEAPGLEDLHERLGFAPNGEPVVQVIKTIHSGHGGKQSVVRVLTGTVSEGLALHRSDGVTDKVSGVSRVIGRDVTKRGPAGPGEVVALAKLEHVKTGDTLAGGKEPVVDLAIIAGGDPGLTFSIRAAERKDEAKLAQALAKVLEEDPSLILEVNQETGETLLSGQGEMHLRVTLEKLAGRQGLAVTSGTPQVPYRETIRGQTTQVGRHKKQSGGHGQFGHVVVEIRPLERGEGFRFVDKITGGVVPRQYIGAVEAGVRDSLSKGPLGFPVVDLEVTLIDGSYHTVDSSDMAFQTAAKIAMREGLEACKPILLEPIERVEVFCPSDATAKINGIVSSRRGQILGFDAREGWPGWDVLQTMMPSAEIGDLIVDLRSATQGVASYRRTFDHLQEVVGRVADQIVARQAAAE